MDIFGNTSPRRRTVVNGLAVAGFVSLMIGSMWLAVYATRFVPVVADRVGAAAVYLGSVFTPAPSAPVATSSATASTTAPVATSTEPVATSTSSTSPATTAPVTPVTPTAGKETTSTVQIGGTSVRPALYGLPDLTVAITKTGYLSTTTAASFIATTTVPAGSRPAIRFTVKNIGTNVSGKWTFSVAIPTQNAYLYVSDPQQSLAPGDSIDYTLGFDQATSGSGKTITVTVDPKHSITQTTTNNDVASTTITVLGS